MEKEEFIGRYGEAAYAKRREQTRAWDAAHIDEKKARNQAWAAANQDKVKANTREQGRKEGKYYEQHKKYQSTGLQHERNLVRQMHRRMYAQHKRTVDPQGITQLHHEWIPGTANYRSVALVDAKLHQQGIIKVIEVLEGEITLFRE